MKFNVTYAQYKSYVKSILSELMIARQNHGGTQ